MPASPEGIRRALEPPPMPQLPLFSEQAKKRVGMARAAGKNPEMLARFRNVALFLAWKNPSAAISIDDVRKVFDDDKIPYTPGNWLGTVFTDGTWVSTGVVTATHEGSHGRLIRTWRRK